MEANLKYTFNNKNIMTIDGCSTLELVKKYGSPLYVMSESIIRNRCEMFSSYMKEIYPNSIVSYASKAFCCKAIYKIIKDYNFACDVVSGGEIATVLASKFDTSKVYFHGNNKTIEEIKFALKNKINNFIVDSIDEVNKILDILNNFKDIKPNIIVRVNPGIEAHTHEFVQTGKTDSKFGIDINSGEAEKTIIQISQNNKLNFLGVHYHIGSQIFDKEPFCIAAKKVIEFCALLKNKHNIDTKVVNVGGGFSAWYTKEDKNLKNEDYKKILQGIVKEIKTVVEKNNLIEPTIVIEPGRSIVAEAGFTLYTVGNIKEIKGIRKYVSIDGGMFENPRYVLYGSKYTAIKCKQETTKQEKVTIVGKCCESGDCIIKDAKLEKLNTGDVIAILTTGAYNYSMASNYNRNTIPPVVLLNKGNSKVIIRGQTFKDILKYDV